MIGYQCVPSAQTSAPSVIATPMASTTTCSSSVPNTDDESKQQQVIIKQEKRDQSAAAAAAVLSSLSSHINLINQHQQSKRPATSSSISCINGSQSVTTNTTTTTTTSSSNGHQQHLHSPGYHSAASSPSSSVASSVSSSSPSSSLASSSTSMVHSNGSSLVSAAGIANLSSVSPSTSRSPISPNLLDYYPELNQDGLGLSWFHDANNRARLGTALMTNKMLVSGDISLAEMSRYPVPIMAKLPLGVSDITLENWLNEVVHAQPQKGIKLTFTSTRTVEPAFRVLARHSEKLKGPLILNADILSRPSASPSNGAQTNGGTNNGCSRLGRAANQQQQLVSQQPVDAWTFLMLCRTRFPKSIISIGWCSAANGNQQQHRQQLASSPGVWGSPTSTTSSSSSLHGAYDIAMSVGADCRPPSLHSSADSMFELDIIDTHLPALQHFAAAAAANGTHQNPSQQSHLGHLQHFNLQQHRLHQHLHPYPLANHHHNQGRHSLGHHQLSQQLGHHTGASGHPLHPHHHHHHHHNHNNNHLQHLHQASLTHHILSSSGSLNSSSGNSSGSPSPTSPISQLMSPHQTVATNLSKAASSSSSSAAIVCSGGSGSGGDQQLRQTTGSVDSTEQLFLQAAVAAEQHAKVAANTKAASSSTAGSNAAAAAALAAVVAASQGLQHQQLPLNLNINEAGHQLTSSGSSASPSSSSPSPPSSVAAAAAAAAAAQVASLSNLAQKIQSYQTINQHNLSQQQASTSHHNGHELLTGSGNLTPSGKLFGISNHHHQQQQSNGLHVHKKTALSANHLSNAPSPQSSSPKHQQSSGNNLLLKTTSQQQQHGVMGYTREMIDKMASLVKEYNLTQPVTFPVEARLLKNSLGELQRLLYQVGSNSTLTVVAQQEDLTSVDDLLTIRKAFASNQVLFDLPDDLAASFKQELDLL